MPLADDETEAAVQEVLALESGGLGNLVDGVQRGVDLQLVGRDLVGAHGAGVGRLGHQAADVVQQRADLAQGAVGRGDHLVGQLAVGDRLLGAGDVAAQGRRWRSSRPDRPCRS